MTDKLIKALKIFIVILVVAAIVLGGWLLYKNVFQKEEEGGGDGGEDVTLTWWVLWEDAENLQVIADAYEKTHPNVSIVIQTQEVESSYKQKIIDKVGDDVEGNAPDIIRIHNTWQAQLEDYLVALPSSTMSETDYSSTFYDTAYSDFSGQNDGIYAIPLMYDGLGVYYNKDLLKDAGYVAPAENWDDFVTQAKKLTEYDDEGAIKIAGAGLGTSSNIDFSFDIVSLLMLQEGATVVDSSGATTFSSDSGMKAAKAIKFYTEFSTRHKVWDRTLPRDITMFSEGRLAMMFAPSWRVHDINDALETVDATLDFDVAPVPQQPALTGEEVNWSNYWGEAVTKESPNAEVAWDFLKFAAEQEQLQNFYEQCSQTRDFGEIYPRVDMASELVSDKYVGAYVKMAPTARSWRMVDYNAVGEEFDDLIENIVTSGGATTVEIQNRLVTLAATVDQIIAEE
jgi:multiple sugar transport system substrate-binding protein